VQIHLVLDYEVQFGSENGSGESVRLKLVSEGSPSDCIIFSSGEDAPH